MLVVGAGAAGLMAAISAAREGARTLLVDRRRKIGAKILISGGTRCNVTNERVDPADFNAPSLPFVRNVLRAFPPDHARALFEEFGVPLKLEPTGKYFPVSDSARDVLAGLLRALDASGARLLREAIVTRIASDGESFVAWAGEGVIRARAVVLATGGLSYPETGSDGIGYEIARGFGHRLVRTSPALTPLLVSPPVHADLAGVTTEVALEVVVDGRTAVRRTGSFLFTHTGYSGPAALDISRHWIRLGWTDRATVEVRASFVPGVDAATLRAAWLRAASASPTRRVATWLAERVPARLARAIVDAAGGAEDLTFGNARREVRERAIALTTAMRLPVTGVAGYRKAEVTAGGVAIDEVVGRSLESKLRPGLFFAGEILDVDGYIGGYNFQWAWSSGWVAGRAAARYDGSG